MWKSQSTPAIRRYLKLRSRPTTTSFITTPPYSQPNLSLSRTLFNTFSRQSMAERFLADRNPPLCSLEVSNSFQQLRYVIPSPECESRRLRGSRSPKEKLYAHYVGQASWSGARIIQQQATPDAEALYDLLILVFSQQSKHELADLDQLKSSSQISDEQFECVLHYASQVRAFHPTIAILYTRS